jgi:hypothetical protein
MTMRFGKWVMTAALAALAFSAPSLAGISGSFYSSQPVATKTFVPGEIYTLTITANTSNATGVRFSSPFVLNPNMGSQFQIVSGGTCALATAYLTGQTCTVNVQFTGTSPGLFNADLLGQCEFAPFVAVGGYSISCNSSAQGRLGVFAGTGVAAGVDALGPTGFAALILSLLGLGAFFTLRRPS